MIDSLIELNSFIELTNDKYFETFNYFTEKRMK